MHANDLPRLSPPNYKAPVVATRIYDRAPEWKFHTDMGKAKNAIAYGDGYDRDRGQIAREGEIWVLNDGNTWELYYHVKPDTPVRDLPWRNKN